MGESKFQLALFDSDIASLYLTELHFENDTPIDTFPIDVSSAGGLAGLGALMLTPWNSALFSETRLVDGADYSAFSEIFKPYLAGVLDQFNPYHFGWPAEFVLLDETGASKVIKHYAMGRVFASSMLIMPDNKTVYLNDGKHSGNLYVFIAQEPGSLGSGKLFGVSFANHDQLAFLPLGESTSVKVKLRLGRADFNKLFKVGKSDGAACTQGATAIQSVWGGECLSLNSAASNFAGLLEPARVFSLQGGIGPGTEYQSIRWNQEQQRVELVPANGATRSFAVNHQEHMNSGYILEYR
jgi:hypothetical protein